MNLLFFLFTLFHFLETHNLSKMFFKTLPKKQFALQNVKRQHFALQQHLQSELSTADSGTKLLQNMNQGTNKQFTKHYKLRLKSNQQHMQESCLFFIGLRCDVTTYPQRPYVTTMTFHHRLSLYSLRSVILSELK